ncbi:MAG: multidrug ABC transporter ATP-binding protein [Micavibrio sp.]|nr:multidrug ABC transporter ATP-binding protein [Micavibrio sp.]|tara:strand:- start:1574 stop:2503 length:930 start_codon:yes stop_codon:yes gene_type:complete
MQNAIEIKNLNKTYKASGKSPEKVALKDINLDIPRGSIFGLLGPNGAGKSTIINILAGLVMKSAGDINIWDLDIDKNPRNAKSAIGIVPQEINFDPFFTPKQLLDIQAGLYGVPKLERRTDELLEMVELTDKADAYSRALSGGMKRRLMVAKALAHSPPILVLDEPTAGVDVELRKMLWENVKKLNQSGVTVVLTTHYLEEAEELCDKIAIINHGQIVANEEKETLLARIDNKEIRFRFIDEVKTIPSALDKFNPEKEGRRTIVLRYSPQDQCMGEVLDILQKENLRVADISTDESDLEDVFLQLTSVA